MLLSVVTLRTALEMGAIYSLVALALFISFSILNIADLSTDGCYTLGFAVGATVTLAGHPFLALPAAMLAGALSGFVTAFLQTKLGVESILAGIIVNTGLYTVNLAVMGWSSNLSIFGTDTLLSLAKGLSGEKLWTDWSTLIVLGVLLAAVSLLVGRFLRTRLGLSIRATGDNEEMVRASSINADLARTGGVMLANSLVALSGALLCQQQRYADLNCGSSMLVMGLASVIIGQVLFGDRGMVGGLISAVGGSLVYRVVIQAAYKVNMPSYTVKLLSTLIVVCALAVPLAKRKLVGKGAAA